MRTDLIFMKRSYDMKPYFLAELEKQIEDMNTSRTFTGIVEAIQCIDFNNYNIEHYLFMKYGETFITELLMSKNDYKKTKDKTRAI